jgi:glycosyltransferase involved in cell wall biosynthesis
VTWDHPFWKGANRRRKALARFAWSRARSVVANDSEFLREMGVEVEPGTRLFEEVAPRRFLIPNVVDTDRFSPGPGLPALAGATVILVPRNIVFGRGIHLAVEAFAPVARERHDALLIVAGEWFERGYRDEVTARIAQHGLAGRVLFTGRLPHAALVDLYRSAALTLIPSICYEGTSLAALESMSCGTPVVATRVGGLKDLPAVLASAEPEPLSKALFGALEARDEQAALQRSRVLDVFSRARWRETWLRALRA